MNFQSPVSQTRQSLIAPTLFALLKPSAVVSSFYRCFAVIIYGAIPEIGDSRETLAYSFAPLNYFQLVAPRQTCLRSDVICFANYRSCGTSVPENKFSHIAPQPRQSTIEHPHFGLLSAAAAVSKNYRCSFIQSINPLNLDLYWLCDRVVNLCLTLS